MLLGAILSYDWAAVEIYQCFLWNGRLWCFSPQDRTYSGGIWEFEPVTSFSPTAFTRLYSTFAGMYFSFCLCGAFLWRFKKAWKAVGLLAGRGWYLFGKMNIAAIKSVFWKKGELKDWQCRFYTFEFATDFMSNLKNLSLIISCKIDIICKMTTDFWMKNAM